METIRCKQSIGGAQVTCVGAMGVYENGTYMYNQVTSPDDGHIVPRTCRD